VNHKNRWTKKTETGKEAQRGRYKSEGEEAKREKKKRRAIGRITTGAN
jgi:hypothetical protein